MIITNVPSLAEIDAELTLRLEKQLADDADDLPALTRLATRLEPGLRRRFLSAVNATKDGIDLEALAAAVMAGQATQAEAALGLGALSERLGEFGPAIRQGFLVGAQAGSEVLSGAGIDMSLDLVNPAAEAWARTQSASLVTNITEETRGAVQEFIGQAFSEGRAPRQTAQELRDILGLTRRDARAVENLRARLLAEGVTPEKVALRGQRYADALLRRRALNVARTEIQTASNSGQQALWREARVQGFLDPEVTRRKWIVTPDDRLDLRICEPLDGELAELEKPFPGGFLHPPAHSQCRCATGLVFLKE